jgi:hypothetical protein
LRVCFEEILPGIFLKKAHREPGEREMEVAFGSFVEDLLSEGGGGFGCRGPDGPEENVELRRKGWDEEVRRFAEALVKFERGGVAGFEAFREGTSRSVGEELLRGPESDSRGTGAGALEGDLAEVKVF